MTATPDPMATTGEIDSWLVERGWAREGRSWSLRRSGARICVASHKAATDIQRRIDRLSARGLGEHSAMMTPQELEQVYPVIPWREPLMVLQPGAPDYYYACRICIAQRGLQGRGVPLLPKTRAEFEAHFVEAHPL